MKIYNTLTKTVEEFVPNQDGIVKMYTCGPTVYNYAHIGNLRTYIFEDILEKGLTFLGYKVERVMNITDVGHLTNDSDDGDDKMLTEAKKESKTVREIADFYTEAFFKDLDRLNIKKPELIYNASHNIDRYILMISKLLEDGFAYISNGNVYFDITKANDYYQLSGKNPDELKVGVRDSVEEDTAKKNPYDFGLWFTDSKFANQEMKWDSPWGIGYPGWHIECSGIATKYLGEYLDIHCGGIDNIFPHHSNEIAQSEAFLGHKWCNYWVHGEYLNDASGKMSKSKGEFLTINLLIEKGYNPLAYRYFCLGSHYRKGLTFTYDNLDIASSSYNKLLNRIKKLSKEKDNVSESLNLYINKFKEAIENDLNTSSMLTLLYDLLKDNNVNDYTKRLIISEYDKVLSLDLLIEEDLELDFDIDKLIEERNIAKANKDFAKADKIRDDLLSKGIKLIDSRDGTSYERI